MMTTGSHFARQIALRAGRLRQGLPGVPTLLSMAPAGRGYVPMEVARAGGCREAAALVLLYPWRGAAHVVLTLRQAGLAQHGGQVSFPGGRCEPGETALACALREADEELAVPPARLEILGPLTPLFIAPSGHCLQAILAATPERPSFRAATAEVAAVIEMPLAQLTDKACRARAPWTVAGAKRDVPYFPFDGHRVWGATAMLLAELGALWSDVLALEEADD